MNKQQANDILESNTVTRDLLYLFLGKKIGQGISRGVYECKLDSELVIKVELQCQSFQNIKEWEFWQDVQHIKGIAKWLSPCVSISECGTVLIQKKVYMLRDDELPKKIPEFLSDVKQDNFGILDGNFVCIDYGFTAKDLHTNLVKADW